MQFRCFKIRGEYEDLFSMSHITVTSQTRMNGLKMEQQDPSFVIHLNWPAYTMGVMTGMEVGRKSFSDLLPLPVKILAELIRSSAARIVR